MSLKSLKISLNWRTNLNQTLFTHKLKEYIWKYITILPFNIVIEKWMIMLNTVTKRLKKEPISNYSIILINKITFVYNKWKHTNMKEGNFWEELRIKPPDNQCLIRLNFIIIKSENLSQMFGHYLDFVNICTNCWECLGNEWGIQQRKSLRFGPHNGLARTKERSQT